MIVPKDETSFDDSKLSSISIVEFCEKYLGCKLYEYQKHILRTLYSNYTNTKHYHVINDRRVDINSNSIEDLFNQVRSDM